MTTLQNENDSKDTGKAKTVSRQSVRAVEGNKMASLGNDVIFLVPNDVIIYLTT